jgi:hypothetical protein
VRQLPVHEASTLAAWVDLEDRLTRMTAELVPEDDPAYIETLAAYRDLPGVELAEGCSIALLIRTDAAPAAVITEGGEQVNEHEPEPEKEPQRLLIVTGPDNTPQAWMDAPEAS